MARMLVTGGLGFIGSNFIRHLLAGEDDTWTVVNLDAVTYAGNPANLADLADHPRYRFVQGRIEDAPLVQELFQRERPAVVVNFAAESHVDRSIIDPGAFVQTNVLGTQVLLDAARQQEVRLFYQIGTDEEYGALGPTGYFTEETPLAPRSPYSASKAAASHLVQAYHHTYGLPTAITRCSNCYGPYQFPEKLIPLFITNAMAGEPLPVYGDGLYVRDWLHVEDHCRAIVKVINKAKPGAVYNVGGHNEKTNLAVTDLILEALGRPPTLIRHVKDRPGHDRRYAIDAARIERELGWRPAYTFEAGIAQTIRWYQEHEDWWQPLKVRAVESQRAADNKVSSGQV